MKLLEKSVLCLENVHQLSDRLVQVPLRGIMKRMLLPTAACCQEENQTACESD